MSSRFFENIQGFTRFSELAESHHFVDAPADWYVVVCDVQNSTQAIAHNQYKQVNLAGAAAIIAVLNVVGDTKIPYVFGGDGMSMLIPPPLVDATQCALQSVQAKIRKEFGLELRVGHVPMRVLHANGTWLRVGKYHLSARVSQAVFQGNALALAETWLKNGDNKMEHSHGNVTTDPDLHGLECRWQPIENRNGMMLSLLVRVTPSYADQAWNIYADILHDIENIYPYYQQSCPTHAAAMHLSFSPTILRHEVKLRGGNKRSTKAYYLLRILLLNLIGLFCIKTGGRAGAFDGKEYLAELVSNSDVRKFDEMLRMVIDSTPEQKQQLERMLLVRSKKGEVVYGIHQSSQALMTCLVFGLSGDHVHFIDGADGGYALASQQIKQQIALL